MANVLRRILFQGYPAHVKDVNGTLVTFWTRPEGAPGHDPRHPVVLDFVRVPSEVGKGISSWDEVMVDDHDSKGGLSTIGPDAAHKKTGAVYIDLAADLEDVILLTDNAEGRVEEYQCLLVAFNDGSVKRFNGFFAVVSEDKKTLEVSGRGRSKTGDPTVKMDAAILKLPVVDARLTTIELENTTSGFLFLDEAFTHDPMTDGNAILSRDPKLPIGTNL